MLHPRGRAARSRASDGRPNGALYAGCRSCAHPADASGERTMSELREILRNHMKEKLAANEVVASMTVRFARSIEIAAIAKTAGFDTLYVDLEHNTLSIDTCCQICISAQQIGITPLVRVPANTPGLYRPGAGWRRDGCDHAACPFRGGGSGDGGTGEIPAAGTAVGRRRAVALPVSQLPDGGNERRDERCDVAGGDDGDGRGAGECRGDHRHAPASICC